MKILLIGSLLVFSSLAFADEMIVPLPSRENGTDRSQLEADGTECATNCHAMDWQSADINGSGLPGASKSSVSGQQ